MSEKEIIYGQVVAKANSYQAADKRIDAGCPRIEYSIEQINEQKKYFNMEKKEDEMYCYLQYEYNGILVIFRVLKTDRNVIQARFDNNFARANGYKSVADMIEKTLGKVTFDKLFGGVPQWINITQDGQFYFEGKDKRYIN